MVRVTMANEFMTANQVGFPVDTMARAMKVSRSGFYAWIRGEPSARDLANRELLTKIRRVHKTSKQTYGAPRFHSELAA